MKVITLFKNETQLIEKAMRNHRGAQQHLYEKYAPKMLSVCRQYIKDLQFAEDVMLKGFFKVFNNLKSFKNEGSFEGWIRKIMVREAISFLRKQDKLKFSEDMSTESQDSIDPIESDLHVTHIQSMIDKLPEGYKAVFILYAVEGYKHQEIAELLKISEGTSKSQLFKARKMLQEHLITIKQTSYGTN
jgi:RNA polymerase sigma-70 factor (ECF subfamily)